MRAPSFTSLRSAASHGPIILINHCKWRSDILMIFHDSLPCSIPTPKHFFVRTNELRDELVKAQKCGLDGVEYQDALCSVLKGLYELVGEPVIKRLRDSGVGCARAISNLVVPNLSLLFSPSSRHGPDPTERYLQTIFLGSIHTFIYAITFCPHRVSQGGLAHTGNALFTPCCPTRRLSARR
jgi:hypothetical protein